MGFGLGDIFGGMTAMGPLSSLGGLFGGGGGGLFGGGGSPPGAPDYNSLAGQQIGYGQQVQGMNAPNQYGLFGQTTYDKNAQGGVTGVHTGLNPEMQALYQSLMGGLGTRPDDVSKSVYGQYTANLDPQWQQSEMGERDRLANQGIPESSQAYSSAMDQFNRTKQGAYLQANQAAQQAGGAEQSRLLQGLFGLGNASTAGYQNVPQVATPNIFQPAYQNFGAQQDAYNQQLAGRNANMQGLFGLGAAGLRALPFLMA